MKIERHEGVIIPKFVLERWAKLTQDFFTTFWDQQEDEARAMLDDMIMYLEIAEPAESDPFAKDHP